MRQRFELAGSERKSESQIDPLTGLTTSGRIRIWARIWASVLLPHQYNVSSTGTVVTCNAECVTQKSFISYSGEELPYYCSISSKLAAG